LGNFLLAKEADRNNKSDSFGKEMTAVQLVCIMKDGKEEMFDLCVLNVDQIQQLCKNVGVTNCGNSTKNLVLRLHCNYFSYQKSLKEQGVSHQTHEHQTTSTILCAVNVVFSDKFIIDFLTINDHKACVDHEMGTTHKEFFICACDAHNACDEASIASSDNQNGDNSNYMLLVYLPGDMDLEKQDGINLRAVDQFTAKTFCKKIMDLFAIRKLIKTNMGVSSQHNGNTWDFIQHAITVTRVKSISHLAVYYFWMRCKHQPGIDESFQPFSDPEIKGSTVDMGLIDLTKSDSRLASSKQKSNTDFTELTAHLSTMVAVQETRFKTQEALMIAQEECEKTGRVCGTAGKTGYSIELLGKLR
jgi:hypothetical protein